MNDNLLERNYYLTLLIILFATVIIGYSQVQQDDMYIFLTYAKNISFGNGYVFNVGERINATTSPLYTLLLALLYYPIKDIYPDSLSFVATFICFISMIVLTKITATFVSNYKIASVLFPFLLLGSPLLKFGFGMETYLNLSLIALTIYYYTKQKWMQTSIFSGFCVLARLDSIILIGLLFADYVIRNKKFPNFLYVIIFISVLLPWFIFSFFYFESIFPTSVSIKINQAEQGFWGDGLLFIKGFFTSIPGTIFSGIFLVVLTLIALIYLWNKKHSLYLDKNIMLIFLWSSILFIVYGFVLNPPPYPWYYSPFSLSTSLLLALVLDQLFCNKKIILQKYLLLMLWSFTLLLPVKTFITGYSPKYLNYIKASEWLNKNAKLGSLLAVDEIGIIGYHYKNGKILDLLGLASPSLIEQKKLNDHGEYIRKYNPDYIMSDYPNFPVYIGANTVEFKKNFKIVWISKIKGHGVAIFSNNTK